MIKIYFDGACEPVNPGGTGSYGFIIKDDYGTTIQFGSGVLPRHPEMTNNIAEYTGLIEALTLLETFNKKESIQIYGDSKLVTEMVGKRWGWKKSRRGNIGPWRPHEKVPHLKVLLDKVLKLLEGRAYTTHWIPREENQECDDLSKKHLKNV